MPVRCVFAVSFVLVLASCGGGPTGLLPGGALTGESTAVPSDWAGLDDSVTIQLETNPSDPYSVNLAVTEVGGAIYLNAGDTETTWVQHIADDPNVRLRIGEKIYSLRAVRVTDAAEIDPFAEAWTARGAWARDPRELDGPAFIYRLETRE